MQVLHETGLDLKGGTPCDFPFAVLRSCECFLFATIFGRPNLLQAAKARVTAPVQEMFAEAS